MSIWTFQNKNPGGYPMIYIVKDNKGNIIMPKKVFEKFQCYRNHCDPSGQSVQVDHDDDLSFKEAMAEVGYAVEAYNPSHD